MSQPVTETQVLERVRAVVAEVLERPPGDIVPTARFVEDLGADSFDLLSLVMALEEEFDRSLPEEESERLTTVGGAVEWIRSRADERAAAADPDDPDDAADPAAPDALTAPADGTGA